MVLRKRSLKFRPRSFFSRLGGRNGAAHSTDADASNSNTDDILPLRRRKMKLGVGSQPQSVTKYIFAYVFGVLAIGFTLAFLQYLGKSILIKYAASAGTGTDTETEPVIGNLIHDKSESEQRQFLIEATQSTALQRSYTSKATEKVLLCIISAFYGDDKDEADKPMDMTRYHHKDIKYYFFVNQALENLTT